MRRLARASPPARAEVGEVKRYRHEIDAKFVRKVAALLVTFRRATKHIREAGVPFYAISRATKAHMWAVDTVEQFLFFMRGPRCTWRRVSMACIGPCMGVDS